MGYHTHPINKGTPGEPSKIQEEFEEFKDAIAQESKLMALIELSDILGAISLYLEKYHPSLDIYDLAQMASLTRSAFQDGSRK